MHTVQLNKCIHQDDKTSCRHSYLCLERMNTAQQELRTAQRGFQPRHLIWEPFLTTFFECRHDHQGHSQGRRPRPRRTRFFGRRIRVSLPCANSFTWSLTRLTLSLFGKVVLTGRFYQIDSLHFWKSSIHWWEDFIRLDSLHLIDDERQNRSHCKRFKTTTAAVGNDGADDDIRESYLNVDRWFERIGKMILQCQSKHND